MSKAHIRPEVLVSHGNARTTVHGRKLIVARHRAGWRQAHNAAAMGISRKCVRTWITRFEAEGVAGLVDRSSRPRTSPKRTATTSPLPPAVFVQVKRSPGLTLNFWQRRGVTATVISSLVRSFCNRTDHVGR